MSARARRRRQEPRVLPYMPGRPCPRCQAEGAQPAHHPRPVRAVFGRSAQWPCSGLDAVLGAHMCLRCDCGYTWMESLPEEAAMGFVKTASGTVTGTDQGGLARTGARGRQWDRQDEAALDAENEAADQGGEEEDGRAVQVP